MTNKQRIISYLQNHPEGIDDDKLAKVLDLSTRQQANMRCRELEKEGLVIRQPINGKIHNFWVGNNIQSLLLVESHLETKPAKFEYWFWEGNVQTKVVEYLRAQGYQNISEVDTASHQRGIDIKAEQSGISLWVTVKGYPIGTKKTNPSVQAAHWFKHAIFNIVQYRERDKEVLLAVALPDKTRYQDLAKKITWFKPIAKFSYFWVRENGEVSVE